jgi:hypothetical protein
MKLWKLLWKLLGKGKSQRNSKVGSKLPNQKQPLQREDAKFKTSFSPFLNNHSCGMLIIPISGQTRRTTRRVTSVSLIKKKARSLVWLMVFVECPSFAIPMFGAFIELEDGKIYRKALYLMVKTMVSCRFSLKPIQ